MTAPSSKSLLLFALGLLGLVAALPLVAGQISRGQSVGRTDDPEAVRQRNQSAFARILGEFRVGVSDMLFLKTERYLDSGIAYEPHIDTDAMAQTGEIRAKEEEESSSHDHDHHQGHDHSHEEEMTTDPVGSLDADVVAKATDRSISTGIMRVGATIKPGEILEEEGHEGVPTMIRTAEDDFRGWIGDLERRVKPWRDPKLGHRHTAGTELLPWYRLATLSNPKSVRAYLIGAWWLKTLDTPEQLEEGLRFTEEGLRNNPEAFQLMSMRGQFLRAMGRDEDAEVAFDQAADTGIKACLKMRENKEPLDDSFEEDLTMAVTMSSLLARDLQGMEAAIRKAEGYNQRLGSWPPLERLLRRLRGVEDPPQN